MSTKNRKLQVFVSSTFTDLRDERQAAVEAILKTRHIPAGMELFAAGDKSQMEVIKEWIRDSDVYMLILGGRYGTMDADSGKSYTHLEFEYALEQKKPLFSVVITNEGLNAKVREGGPDMIETENGHKLREFRDLVTSRMVSFWSDLKDIKLAVHESLAEIERREDLVGWVRGDQATNNVLLAEEIARLGKANSELRTYLSELEQEIEKKGSPFFEDLYEIFEETEIDLSNFPSYRIESWPSDEEVNANEFLLITQKLINGFVKFDEHDFQKFFSFFSNYNLIDYEIIRDTTFSSLKVNRVTSKFTQIGVEYLVFLEKKNRNL